jgi:predicted  nucleic acid-binding Zn-ribbon protein
MPHQCTNCDKVFPDGSKEMLSGCPNCGGNKFQFRPSGSAGTTDGAASSTRSEGVARPSAGSTPTESQSDPAPVPDRDVAAGSTESPTWRRAAERAAGVDRPTGGEGRSGADRPADAERTADVRRSTDAEPAADDGPTPDAPTESIDAPTESIDAPTESADVEETSAEASRGASGGLSERANRAGKSVREWVNSRGADRSTESGAESGSEAASSASEAEAGDSEVRRRSDREDSAQASARSAVVSRDELAAAADRAAVDEADGPPTDVDGTVIEPENDDRPGLDDLREELNSQFESIKIVAPGEYELNLMELYDRTEYIISLQEDGRYVIEVPDSWGDRDPADE